MDIEVLQHLKSEKFFVLLDDSRMDRFKVINPAGVKLLMPAELFSEEPELLSLKEAEEKLTAEQFNVAMMEFRNEESQAEQFIAHIEKKAETPTVSKESTKRATPRKRKEKVNTKRGLGASWSSSSLTFYRHHIDPLGPKQSFRVVIDNLGTFEMTREEFQSVFNDVIMSNKYRQEGYFSYPSLPEKAQRFLKVEGV